MVVQPPLTPAAPMTLAHPRLLLVCLNLDRLWVAVAVAVGVAVTACKNRNGRYHPQMYFKEVCHASRGGLNEP